MGHFEPGIRQIKEEKPMNLNFKQKAAILIGIILLIISFVVPPCYFSYQGNYLSLGYKPLAIFRANPKNLVFLHTPTFYAEIILICLITIGFVLILGSNKNNVR